MNYFDREEKLPGLNQKIEAFIAAYVGTSFGLEVANMYSTGVSYEKICETLDWDIQEFI